MRLRRGPNDRQAADTGATYETATAASKTIKHERRTMENTTVNLVCECGRKRMIAAGNMSEDLRGESLKAPRFVRLEGGYAFCRNHSDGSRLMRYETHKEEV